MGVLAAMRTILPLALTSGINLYLTVLVVGLSIRFNLVTDIPPGLTILASPAILLVAAVFYIIEFIADKVPFIDTLWDLIHTVIRPAGAILIATSTLEVSDPAVVGAAASLVGVNPRVELAGAVVACAVALLSHSGKAGTRTAVNASGGGITLVGVGLSLLEDLFVAVIAFLALRYPLAANIAAGVIIVLLILVVPQLLRWAWFTLRSITAWIKGYLRPIREAEPALVDEEQRAIAEDEIARAAADGAVALGLAAHAQPDRRALEQLGGGGRQRLRLADRPHEAFDPGQG